MCSRSRVSGCPYSLDLLVCGCSIVPTSPSTCFHLWYSRDRRQNKSSMVSSPVRKLMNLLRSSGPHFWYHNEPTLASLENRDRLDVVYVVGNPVGLDRRRLSVWQPGLTDALISSDSSDASVEAGGFWNRFTDTA